MSAVCVLTPILIGSWPAISAAIASAAASLGFAIATAKKDEIVEVPADNTVETVLPNSQVMDDIKGRSETLRIDKDGISIIFKRDERGACTLCVSGPLSKRQLEQIGQEVAGRVTQQFAYHKLMTELKKHNYSVVEERVQNDSSIRVRVRLNG
ncbi:MAG: DUF1257 domain-containing protein [Phycisphaerae bacterium]|jgi:hypothetical protein